MGLIQKKDERDELDGIEVIGRGEGPDGLDANPVELVAGESAEDIAAGTTAAEAEAAAREQMVADAADEALMEGIEPNAAEEPEPEPGADEDPASPEEDTVSTKAKKPEKVEKSQEGPAAPRAGKLPANHGKLFAALGVALVIVAGVGGYVVGNGGIGSKGTGSATISEDQLDTAVATYTYKGAKHDVTSREAIEAQYSLDNAKDEDGNYAASASETIVAYVRNQILMEEAEKRGIEVTDDEMEGYAQQSIGTSDYATMAEQYGLSKDQAKQVVKEQTTLNKLYEDVTSDADDAGTLPDAPTEPESGDTSTASKDYADYIIKLAGDEWDAGKGTWASEDGPYYSALKDEEFTADSATYAQAQKAYYVAYSQYASASQEKSNVWKDFENGLMKDVDIKIYGLYV